MTKPEDRFRDSGRLVSSVKRPRPAKPVVVPVYVVQTETGKIFRVTNDKVDAERYAAAYDDVSSHRKGSAKIIRRFVTL